MNKKLQYLSAFSLCFFISTSHAVPDRTQLAVWANEAIVATYTYDYKQYLENQKAIAKYFTSTGWIAYSKALNDSKLPDLVKKNQYTVSAVATSPPELSNLDETHWVASMPILVLYKNPQYQQKQALKVVIIFTQATSGLGVRGLSITSLNATEGPAPCP